MEECGLIDLLEPGDAVKAYRDFDIQHFLPSKILSLNIPFMREKQQLSLEEEVKTRSIASVCIAQRAIERVKKNHILQIIPISLHAQLDQMFYLLHTYKLSSQEEFRSSETILVQAEVLYMQVLEINP